MKKTRLAILMSGVILATSMTACSGKDSKSSDEGTKTETSAKSTSKQTSLLDEIIERGVLRVGTSTDGVPMEFIDENGDWVGYDLDWAQQMADELGVKLEMVVVDGETRISSVASGVIDVSFCCITGNTERAKTVAFSIPYIKNGMKILLKADSPYNTLEDLNKSECKIAVCRGTTGEEIAMKYAPEAELVYVQGYSEQVLMVQQGKADALCHDNSSIDYSVKTSNGELKACEELYTSDPICACVPRGDQDFLNWVNLFISSNITNGFQRDTYMKWFDAEPGELTTIW